MLSEPRVRRYSGRDRPAWRMNQTGVWLEGSPRQAARNGLLDAGFTHLTVLAAPIPGEAGPHKPSPGAGSQVELAERLAKRVREHAMLMVPL
jgi:hypothetical protein